MLETDGVNPQSAADRSGDLVCRVNAGPIRRHQRPLPRRLESGHAPRLISRPAEAVFIVDFPNSESSCISRIQVTVL